MINKQKGLFFQFDFFIILGKKALLPALSLWFLFNVKFCRQGTRQNVEQRHKSTYHVVDAIILLAQYLQYHPYRIQTYRHHQYLAEVEEQRILSDPFIVHWRNWHKKGFIFTRFEFSSKGIVSRGFGQDSIKMARFFVSTQFRAYPFERALFSALNRVLLIN